MFLSLKINLSKCRDIFTLFNKLYLDLRYTLNSQNILNFPTFCNGLVWITWRARDKIGMVFNCCGGGGGSEESLCV